jgi:T-complex protein 11
VKEVPDVEGFMQQLKVGVADLEKLASSLSRILKSNCAPMRDEWVDDMCEYLSNGNGTPDVAIIVIGFQEIFRVLEAIKLVRHTV